MNNPWATLESSPETLGQRARKKLWRIVYRHPVRCALSLGLVCWFLNGISAFAYLQYESNTLLRMHKEFTKRIAFTGESQVSMLGNAKPTQAALQWLKTDSNWTWSWDVYWPANQSLRFYVGSAMIRPDGTVESISHGSASMMERNSAHTVHFYREWNQCKVSGLEIKPPVIGERVINEFAGLKQFLAGRDGIVVHHDFTEPALLFSLTMVEDLDKPVAKALIGALMTEDCYNRFFTRREP